MASIDSQAAFMNRVRTIGVPEVDMNLLDRGNLALFAMDSALKDLLRATLGADKDADVMSSHRRLFYESFTRAAAELRSRLDRSEEQGRRKLRVPERSVRQAEQKRELTGLVLEGELEPSDGLIDFVYSLYEEDRLHYVQWDRCRKKDAEVASSSSRRQANWEEEMLKDDVSSNIMIRDALQRRSIAFDQATLAALDRGLSYLYVGKQEFYSSIGSRYFVVKPSYELLTGVAYAMSGGATENAYGAAQQEQ